MSLKINRRLSFHERQIIRMLVSDKKKELYKKDLKFKLIPN
jgi:hypothetical protein